VPTELSLPPLETTAASDKTVASKAADKLASDSMPEATSKPNLQDQAADNASMKKMGLPDVELVDDKPPAPKPASSDTPVADKPANQEPTANSTAPEKSAPEKPAPENPGRSEPSDAPKASETPPPEKSPAGAGTDSSKPTEPSAGNNPESSDPGGAKTVLRDVGKGALNEVDDHPGRLVADAAIGVGIGIGATLAVASAPVWGTVAVGTAAVAGAAYGIDKLVKDMPGWIDDVKVADKPADYTTTDVQQSTTGLNQLGAGLADNAAGALGGMDGAAFAGGLASGLGLTTTLVADASSTTDKDAVNGLDKTLTDKSDPSKTSSDASTPKSGKPSGPDVVEDGQNPANYIREVYGQKGEQAAQAYEMARNLLGDNVQGIAGSYARGAARTGQWSVGSYDEALGLDKMPEDLPSSVVEQMPPEPKALYNLKQQLPTIPSDLDVVVGTYSANLPEIATQIFDATGVLVEFCPVKA
jgi:hypothetical protein